MNEITWEDFQKVELRVGTVLRVEEFPNARNPSYILNSITSHQKKGNLNCVQYV